MKLVPMRFKGVEWHHNPREITFTFDKTVTETPSPFGKAAVQNLGRKNRLIQGEGELYGADCTRQFRRLLELFKSGGSGALAIPKLGTYKAAQQGMEYDISSSSWSGDYLDPATFVELWRSGGGNNCTGWGNPAFDEDTAAAAATGDAATRSKHLQQAEQRMLQEHPIIPLYHSERTYLRSARHIHGRQPRLLDNFPLDAVEVVP